MKSQQIEILNAVFTPMFADGSINYSQVPELFEHCLQTGAQGIFLNGTTGECMSLSVQERQQLVETWIEYRKQVNRPDFKIFVHVGSCNLYETAQMAEHAQSQQVNGIAMVPTFYFRPKTLNELIEQCEFVAAAASQTPFYYYNIPSLTGVDFPMIKFLEMAIQRIPNFAGLKNSFSNVVDYQHCIHYAQDNYAMYWGSDEAFMMLYTAGNRHYVGSTYNYMSNVYNKMLKAFHAGDFENLIALEKEADDIYKVILQYHGVSSGKEIMRLIGVDCGPVRKPLNAFNQAESETLLRKLKETTFFRHSITKNTAVSIM